MTKRNYQIVKTTVVSKEANIDASSPRQAVRLAQKQSLWGDLQWDDFHQPTVKFEVYIEDNWYKGENEVLFSSECDGKPKPKLTTDDRLDMIIALLSKLGDKQ